MDKLLRGTIPLRSTHNESLIHRIATYGELQVLEAEIPHFLLCEWTWDDVAKVTNARVLVADFVPTDVVHRDAEINTPPATLNPLTRGGSADPVHLVGPLGTGKTSIAKYAVDQLREAVLDTNTQYVNCWENYFRYQALYRILEGLDRSIDIHRQSIPTDELTDRLRNYGGPPYIVALDEFDQFADINALYNVYRSPQLELVLIANREVELFAQLDDRVVSRLQTAARIHFDVYGTEALVWIFEDRGIADCSRVQLRQTS